jgi:hypothetical protein
LPAIATSHRGPRPSPFPAGQEPPIPGGRPPDSDDGRRLDVGFGKGFGIGRDRSVRRVAGGDGPDLLLPSLDDLDRRPSRPLPIVLDDLLADEVGPLRLDRLGDRIKLRLLVQTDRRGVA